MYMKVEMTGVGELSRAKFLMALVVGRGLGTVSEVSGCSEKFEDSVQVKGRRKAPFCLSPAPPYLLHFLSECLLRCGTLTPSLVL